MIGAFSVSEEKGIDRGPRAVHIFHPAQLRFGEPATVVEVPGRPEELLEALVV